MRGALSCFAAIATCLPAWAADPTRAELIDVRKIWDRAPHNAFTDLARLRGRWYCVFREGQAHVSSDGAIRVLTSADGKTWQSAALVRSETADLRDPKLTVTPNGTLMLLAGAALHRPEGHTHESFVWFSKDGRDWGQPVQVADPNYWLWRVTWHKGTAYGIGYECGTRKDVRLYRSADGRRFERWVAPLYAQGYPNETALVFEPDDTCRCLVRRDEGPRTALLGTARPPYKEWSWKDLGNAVGGPNMLRLPDGRLIAVVRLYQPRARTAVCAIDPDAGRLHELLTLPSGGDTSYAGMVWHEGVLWASYYSSHEKRTSVYLARVRIRPTPEDRKQGQSPPAGTVRIAGVVLKWVRGDKEANYRRAEPLIREAAAHGARIVCTRECFLDGYAIADKSIPLERYRRLGEPVPDGPYARRLAVLAGELRVHVVAGMVEADGPARYNTAVLFGPDGRLQGKYRKQKLGHEAGRNTPGHASPVFATPHGRMGLVICADRTEPTIVGRVCAHGADFLVCPSGGMFGPAANDPIVQARSRENRVPIVFVHPAEFLVTAPDGSVAARTLLGDRLLVAPGEVAGPRDASRVCYYDLPQRR